MTLMMNNAWFMNFEEISKRQTFRSHFKSSSTIKSDCDKSRNDDDWVMVISTYVNIYIYIYIYIYI